MLLLTVLFFLAFCFLSFLIFWNAITIYENVLHKISHSLKGWNGREKIITLLFICLSLSSSASETKEVVNNFWAQTLKTNFISSFIHSPATKVKEKCPQRERKMFDRIWNATTCWKSFKRLSGLQMELQVSHLKSCLKHFTIGISSRIIISLLSFAVSLPPSFLEYNFVCGIFILIRPSLLSPLIVNKNRFLISL